MGRHRSERDGPSAVLRLQRGRRVLGRDPHEPRRPRNRRQRRTYGRYSTQEAVAKVTIAILNFLFRHLGFLGCIWVSGHDRSISTWILTGAILNLTTWVTILNCRHIEYFSTWICNGRHLGFLGCIWVSGNDRSIQGKKNEHNS